MARSTRSGGDSGQGKTTILESIEGALRGLDPTIVRNGERRGEIELTLSDATVRRLIETEGKGRVTVTDTNGRKVEHAKEFLRALAGPAHFRPVEWVRQSGGDAKGRTERRRAQRDQLLAALSVERDVAAIRKDVEERGMNDAWFNLKLNELTASDLSEMHPFDIARLLHTEAYSQRRVLNQRLEDAQYEFESTDTPKSVPGESSERLQTDLDDVEEQYHNMRVNLERSQEIRDERERFAEQVQQIRDGLIQNEADLLEESNGLIREEAQLREKISDLEEQLGAARSNLASVHRVQGNIKLWLDDWALYHARQAQLDKLDANIAQMTDANPEALKKLADRRAELLDSITMREQHRVWTERKMAYEILQNVTERADKLVTYLRDTLPKDLLAEANLPVPGLSFDEENILINDVPIHQLGTAEQITVGVLCYRAMYRRRGFIPIDGAESLGPKDRAALAKVAKEYDLQLILTYVDPYALPDKKTTVMREGEALTPPPSKE